MINLENARNNKMDLVHISDVLDSLGESPNYINFKQSSSGITKNEIRNRIRKALSPLPLTSTIIQPASDSSFLETDSLLPITYLAPAVCLVIMFLAVVILFGCYVIRSGLLVGLRDFMFSCSGITEI